MKVKIRDESSEDVGTWIICFPIRPVSRRGRDEERTEEAPHQKEDHGEEREP